MKMPYSPWNCPGEHSGEVTCLGCGWSILDDTVFVDSDYFPLTLHKQVNYSRLDGPGSPVRLKVSLFWLNKPTTHTGGE